MKITMTLGLLLMLCLSLVGCGFNKDAEVKSFMTDFDKTTNEMVAKINADPTEKGVEEAQKIWDASRPNLKTKFDGIKEAREMQLSESVKKDFESGLMKDAQTISGLVEKIEDQAALLKFQKLMTDYGNFLQDK